MITVSRDPFARSEIRREKVTRKCECSWCGQPAKWIYYVEDDGIYSRPNRIKGEYCSIQCMREYNS